MFDKLIEFLLNIIEEILPFYIVKEYQEGILLRLGKYKKNVGKGLHFKIPFADSVYKQHTTVTTLNLNPQSLVTLDKQNIVVKGMIKFKVVDVKTFLLEVWGSEDALSDVSQGVIKNIVMSKTFAECTDNEVDNLITKKVRVEARKWGIEVMQVTLTDIAPIRSYRLIGDIVNKARDGE